jgi:hypothetical protein
VTSADVSQLLHRHLFIGIVAEFIFISHKYEACPEIKDTKVLNMYNIFNLQK